MSAGPVVPPTWLQEAVTCEHCATPGVAPVLLCTHCFSGKRAAQRVLRGLARQAESDMVSVETGAEIALLSALATEWRALADALENPNA